MNAIFVKEVTSSVIGKNIVKFDTTSIGEGNYILELNINNKKLADIEDCIQRTENFDVINKKASIVNKIEGLKKQLVLKKFNSDIKKIIKKNELVGFSVIFSNDLKKKRVKRYIEEVLNNFSINEYLCLNSMEKNYIKYIDEYILNNNLKKEDINPIIIAESADSVSLDIIESLNNEYKELSIFCIDKIGKGFQNKVKKINDDVGSCIQILNRNNKDFRRYNIYIFLDRSRTEYLKYKFNRKSCYIDFTNKENDKYNEKYLKLENDIKNSRYYGNKIKELYDLYGKITVSNVIID